MNSTADSAALRRLIYGLLITVAAGAALGRIFGTVRVYEPNLYREKGASESSQPPWPEQRPTPMPSFGSNDRSRWATVRALVDEGTYVLGRRTTDPATGKYQDTGIVFEDGWQSVDKVKDPKTDLFYSSKPPLLPTMAAGEYWLLKHGLGWSITERPAAVMRTIVVTVNWLPWLVYLGLLAALIERFGTTDWGRLYVLAAACFGTLLTPFLITFNNHTVATYSVLFALYPTLRIWCDGALKAWRFALAGLFAGFAACNEFPATAFAVALGALLLIRCPRRTLLWFVPAAVVPVAALLATNYLAIQEFVPVQMRFNSPWYKYEGSHWSAERGTRSGIDFLDERKHVYAFHLLFGHHGMFSLTPINLLAILGAVILTRSLVKRWLQAPPEVERPGVLDRLRALPALALLGGATLVLTVIVVAFYIFQTNNYGGVTNGPRWLLWLTPLWLLTILPIADRLAAYRWGRLLGYVLLGASVLSASYYLWNPWRQPWLYQLMEAAGWVK